MLSTAGELQNIYKFKMPTQMFPSSTKTYRVNCTASDKRWWHNCLSACAGQFPPQMPSISKLLGPEGLWAQAIMHRMLKSVDKPLHGPDLHL